MRLLHLVILLLIASGCTTLPNRSLSLPDRHTLVREPLIVYSDFPVEPYHRLLDELIARRADVSRTLNLPSSAERAHVYLFDSTDRFRQFMRLHHPEMPDRRAFFLETDTRLLVYAQWGDRVAEDLRHEMTHAYLHAVVPNLPLWLDEGLAEYFEVPRGHAGLNYEHLAMVLDQMEQGKWTPNLARLEQLHPTENMSLGEYAESWTWVHFLLHGCPDGSMILQTYLADLRAHAVAIPLSQRLMTALPASNEALEAHIRRIAAVSKAPAQ